MKPHFFKQSVGILLLFLLIIGCTSDEPVFIPENISAAQYLADKQFQPETAILLKDNDLAFAAKIDIIRQAKKEVKLNYYIFSPDESTSFLVNELLKKIKADKDFRVKILTDYQYNYYQLDFFKWLENQQPHGIQQIEIGLYNRPTINIIKLAEFLTLGCTQNQSTDEGLPECAKEKLAYLKKMDTMSLAEAEKAMSIPAKIFLAGLYAQKPNVLLYALQGGYQRSVQSIALAEKAKENKNKITQIKALGMRYLATKKTEGVKKLGAKLALGTDVAGLFLGKQLGPLINSFKTVLPYSIEGVDNLPLMTHPDLEYITDYTHHKFIMGDGHTLQIGGRNIANAYHMHPTHLEKYYTFMDTDMYMTLAEKDGAFFNAAFDRLWNFRTMVASIADVAQHAPPSYLHLIEHMDQLKTENCEGETDAAKKETCLTQLLAQVVDTTVAPFLAKKQTEWDEKFKNSLATYEKYLATKKPFKSWTAIDQIFNREKGYVLSDNLNAPLHSFTHHFIAAKDFHYVENLPFSQADNTAPTKRLLGSEYGKEINHGKGIHKVWMAAFQQACEQSNETGTPTEVIIHQGYFAPPMGVAYEMNRLIKASVCPNVTVKLYTNSILSTDLVPINLIGRRLLFSMSQHNAEVNEEDRFQYFEYNIDPLKNIVAQKYSYPEDEKGSLASYFSLHTKVMIFGNDIYIGSSNTDFRSYLMDTNNGVFIKNAPELVARYKQFLKEIEANKIVAPAKDFFQYPTREALNQQERSEMLSLMKRLEFTEGDTLSSAQKQQVEILFMMLDKASEGFDEVLKEEGILAPNPAIDRLLKMI